MSWDGSSISGHPGIVLRHYYPTTPHRVFGHHLSWGTGTRPRTPDVLGYRTLSSDAACPEPPIHARGRLRSKDTTCCPRIRKVNFQQFRLVVHMGGWRGRFCSGIHKKKWRDICSFAELWAKFIRTLNLNGTYKMKSYSGFDTTAGFKSITWDSGRPAATHNN